MDVTGALRRHWALATAGVVAAVLLLSLWCRGRINHWPIRNDPPRGRTVVAFGDSLTEGYGVPAGGGYPEQLSRLLGITVVNKGVSGNTSADGLARLDDVLAQEPRVVLLCLGGNDMLRRMSPDEQFANLRAAIGRLHQAGALVILIGTEGLPTLMGGVDYGQRYRRLAEETGAVYVPDLLDGVIGDRSLMYDQIHPNAAGYARIARRLADDVGEYLRR